MKKQQLLKDLLAYTNNWYLASNGIMVFSEIGLTDTKLIIYKPFIEFDIKDIVGISYNSELNYFIVETVREIRTFKDMIILQ